MTPDINRRDMLKSSTLAAGVGLAGCSFSYSLNDDEAAVEEGDEEQSVVEPDCDHIELEAISSKPANWVTVNGLQGFGDQPEAWITDAEITDPDDDDRVPGIIDRLDEATGELAVPVHPNEHMDGGPVEVTIESEDGDLTCAGLELELEPLDPAPGTVENTVDDLEAFFAEQAQELGYSAEELRASDPGELPTLVDTLAVALRVIDAPDNPDSIRAALAGEADSLVGVESDEDAQMVVDALAAESGFVEAVGEYIDALRAADRYEGGGPLSSERLQFSGFSSLGGSGAGAFPNSDLFGRSAGLEATAPPEPESVETISHLDEMIEAQGQYEAADSGPTSAMRTGGGVVLAGAAFIPGVNAVAGPLGLALWMADMWIKVEAGRLPSELHLEARGEPEGSEHLEQEDGDIESGEMIVTAEGHSDGFTITVPDALGAVPLGKAADALDDVARYSDEAVEFASNFIDYMEANISAGASAADDGTLPGLDIPAEEYGPVDVEPEHVGEYFIMNDEVLWSEGEQPFAFSADDFTYEAQAVGVMQISLVSMKDAFGLTWDQTTLELEVDPIEIEIERPALNASSGTYYLDPAEDTLFMGLWAEVENAEDPTVEWDLEVRHGPDQKPELDGQGPHNREATFDATGVDFDAWDNPNDQDVVYWIQAECPAEGGVRRDGVPMRTDSATIIITDDVSELEISPVECIPVNSTHEFKARHRNEPLAFEELDWVVFGPASLDDDGTFHPTSTGEMRIEFEYQTIDMDEPVTEKVEFSVEERCPSLSYVGGGRWWNNCECVGHSGLTPIDTDAPENQEPQAMNIDKNPYALRLATPGFYWWAWCEVNISDLFVAVNFPFDPTEGEWEIEVEAGASRDALVSGEIRAADWVYTQQSIQGRSRWVNMWHGTDLTLRRKEVEIDGERVGMYSGTIKTEVISSPGPPAESSEEVTIQFYNALPMEMQPCFDEEVEEPPPPEFEDPN